MPQDGITPVLHEEILTFEEVVRLVKIFAELGIRKLRLTGGEPLVRKNIICLIKSLAGIEAIEEINLTTNGILLADYAQELKKAGISRINISLDTLKKEKFKAITGEDTLDKVWEGIERAKAAGLLPIKINTVVMKGVNDAEIIDFINFAASEKIILRFIEFMKVTPLWKEDYFMAIEEVKKRCAMEFNLQNLEYPGNGPAQYYKAANAIIGFIRTEENNCRQCNRLRLTSTGELKLCLYETFGVSLREILRKGASDAQIKEIIKSNLEMKEKVDYRNWESCKVYMSDVGG